MSYDKPRIELTDDLLSMMVKLAGGNPGAITALTEAVRVSPIIDPDCAFGPIGPLLQLDTLSIYDSDIWVLYKHVCGMKMALMLGLMRAVQLGLMPERELHDFIARPHEIADARKAELLASVQKKLPEFKAAP